MPGYFQLDRDLVQALLPKQGEMYSKLDALNYLASHAAYAPGERLIGQKLIALRLGELVVSERYLQKAWGWSRTKVRKYKETLSSRGFLDQRKDQGETILIVDFTRVTRVRKTGKDTSNQTTEEPPGIPPKDQSIRKKKEEGKTNTGEPRPKTNTHTHSRPSLEEVLGVADEINPIPITKECAQAFFYDREESGWQTSKGFPIADWRASLRKFAAHWNNNRTGSTTKSEKPNRLFKPV